MQDMGNDAGRYDPALAVSDARPQGPRTCGHDMIGGVDGTQAATELDQYDTRHHQFMYFRSIIDDQPYCVEHVVNLDDAFIDDLRSVEPNTPSSFITTNNCATGPD